MPRRWSSTTRPSCATPTMASSTGVRNECVFKAKNKQKQKTDTHTHAKKKKKQRSCMFNTKIAPFFPPATALRRTPSWRASTCRWPTASNASSWSPPSSRVSHLLIYKDIRIYVYIYIYIFWFLFPTQIVDMCYIRIPVLKGHLRKGNALVFMKKWSEALAAFEEVCIGFEKGKETKRVSLPDSLNIRFPFLSFFFFH